MGGFRCYAGVFIELITEQQLGKHWQKEFIKSVKIENFFTVK
ncbi:hypothetical protein [uncultured Gammaproteobacteria bacterium]|nr:hypothetical protein [uncultured Gammaproteobacteria bacterium]CAC9599986.1 hypothetical protein [uncultured Gammaproteobacteria bacterium]CAC9638872.1 hypothetical protein [uncultured Gammaproteobacteria bacterium]CAC9962719.1 hypothetical protein [uncultured Gammaproteobacteria bacterium]CAC9991081.1 hypothetical protein [uncultured Gammaproteobacteria bacterium]